MQLKLLLAVGLAILTWLRFVDAASMYKFLLLKQSNEVVKKKNQKNEWTACASNVTMDVVFTIDASGSIGASSFQVALQWIVQIIDSGLTLDSSVAFIRFATTSQILLDFVQSAPYSQAQLEKFAANIYYTGGNTNTGIQIFFFAFDRCSTIKIPFWLFFFKKKKKIKILSCGIGASDGHVFRTGQSLCKLGEYFDYRWEPLCPWRRYGCVFTGISNEGNGLSVDLSILFTFFFFFFFFFFSDF
ncbi:hypothetical protein RFI_04196 [Reticulomyxa filosa]|uniref:VWFA domain-containing protein n=1 Tax=Reticulomyxa filosa TaxID=46433 RepID=X6P4C4_RETFI|nr:hypothetical protein RFI_04196 [Reticulomyxa filosa]|eukprot:ETO32919.1 hypothetical protein RFI_04196 [Reticulomyxa filosa]